tara:strand:+ start:3473 stop:4207 length:735 start_codon:yes stop_codon:yes gene_type:complete
MELIDIYLVVFVTSILQSVFGVGVLLVGTPLLMILGYSYEEILGFLLPTSLVISLIQSYKYKKYINIDLIKNVFIFTIPLIPIGMFFAFFLESILGVFVGFFLLFITFNNVMEYILPENSSKKRFSIILFFLGFIHGTTNLGGGLLPAIVNINSKLKEEKLSNTATIYIMFQITQLFFLIVVSNNVFDFFPSISLVLLGLFAFYFIGKFLFNRINLKSYTIYLKYFLRFIAIMLIFFKTYQIII